MENSKETMFLNANNFTSVNYYATRILMLLEAGGKTIERLTEQQLHILMLYFYINNPVVNRMVKLKYKLPLSSIFLKKPKVKNQLVQDYVQNYFNNMMMRIDLYDTLKLLLKTSLVYGKAYMLIEDNELLDVDSLEDKENDTMKNMSEEEKNRIEELTNKYNEDSDNISFEEAMEVVKKFMLNYNDDYDGIDKVKALTPFDIVSEDINRDINYMQFEIRKSEHITEYIKDNKTKKDEELKSDLIAIGYGQMFVDKHFEDKTQDTMLIDNDSSNGIWIEPFMLTDLEGENDSEMRAIITDLIRYESSSKLDNEYSKLREKKTNLIKIPEELGEDTALELESRIKNALDQEGETSYVVTNYDVSVEEITFVSNSNSDNKQDVREESKEHIMIGTGTPDSLLNGEDSYGSSYVKMEIMNNEFNEIKNSMKKIVEEKIFKVVAKKRGFVTTNVFGNLSYIFSTLNFEIGSLINTEDFIDKLDSMADDGYVSKSRIMELRGLDPEEEFQKIKDERELAEKMGIELD